MKRHEKDELMMIAFGEMPIAETDARRAALSSDPEAAGELASLSQLREDLRVLSLKVPDAQLSTERMRDAILKQGLKQRNPIPRWSWIGAPVMGAVLAIGIYLSRLPYNEEQNRVAAADLAMPDVLAAKVAMNRDDFQPKTELTDLGHAVRQVYSFGKEEPILSKSPPAVKKSNSDTVAVSDSALAYAPQAESTLSLEATPSSDAPATDAEPTTPTLHTETFPDSDDVALVTPSQEQKVVVVAEDKDGVTGAQKATEVGSSSDVMVGG
jgi:hypothetical protein